MVTREDMIKIVEYLKYYLKKESQFDTKTDITDDDFISFIDKTGDNVFNNCKIKISDLKKHLGNGNSGGGSSATISIYIDEDTNHWIINGEDTGIEATGEQGPQGPQGPAGKDGKNGVDGYDGQPGADGDVYIKKFTKTSSINVKPTFVSDKVDPGSIWSAWLPEYNTGEAVWEIVARISANNTLVENWSGPILMTGIQGPSGGEAATPNWKLTIYTKSDNIPNPPTNTNPDYYTINTDWKPYPTSQGNWWQCICSVDGPTNIISHFSDVILLNGKDGKDGKDGEDGQNGQNGLNGQDGKDGQDGANGKDGIDGKDGKYTEFRFTSITSSLTPPQYSASLRNPSVSGVRIWSTVVPEHKDGYYIWMIQAIINSDETLYQNWSVPVCITIPGPQGETGPTGPQGPGGINGIDGINGVSMEFRYMIGTAEYPRYAWSSSMSYVRQPSNWSLSVPTVTGDYPYIWFIQARINDYSSSNLGTLDGSWSTPKRLSGINGINGKDGSVGKSGQIVYPAGIYSIDNTYTLDDYRAPYVLDPQDGNYYVLNVSSWTGSNQNENNNTPAKNVALDGDEWVKLEAFEAIYAKVGIIANGLIGSAVFNSDYMFSQHGIKYAKNGDGVIVVNTSSNYENFIPETITRILNGEQPLDTFIPNIMFNLKEGNAWFGAGDCTIDAEGNIINSKLAHSSNQILLPAKDNGTISDIKSKASLYGYDYHDYFWDKWTKESNVVTECIKHNYGSLHTIVKNYSVNMPIDTLGTNEAKRVINIRLNVEVPNVWYEGSITYIPYYKNKDVNDYITVRFDSLFIASDDTNWSNSHRDFYLGGKHTTIKFLFRWNGDTYELGVGNMNSVHGQGAPDPPYCIGDLHVINGITKVEDLFDIEEDTPSVDIESLQNLVNSLQTELNNTKSELASMKTTVDRNNSSVISLTSRMNGVENEISDHTSTITDLESRVTTLEQEKDRSLMMEE